jgi:hypothetical protein
MSYATACDFETFITILAALFRFMNKITHFRDLEGHKGPVLRLYRVLLRHSANLPFESSKNGDIRHAISQAFHKNTNMMSGIHARNQLIDAIKWAEILRLTIQGDHTSLGLVKEELENIKSTKDKQALQAAPFKRREKNYTPDPRKGSWLDEYNQAAHNLLSSEDPVAACLFKSTSRIATNRGRALRKFSNEFREKYKLDELYIEAFIIPEYRNQHDIRALKWRIQVESSRPLTMKLTTFRTSMGQFSYLKLPGKRASTNTMQYMHNYRKDVFHEIRHTTDYDLMLAQFEDDWEDLLDKTFGLPKPPGSYTSELREMKEYNNQKREAKMQLLSEHRKVLEARKFMWDRTLAKGFAQRVQYWKNYEPEKIHKMSLWSGPKKMDYQVVEPL